MSLAVDPSYPVGRFDWNANWSQTSRQSAIDELAAVPSNTRGALNGMDDALFDTPYRTGGWTIRQVVHHIADSQMHGYIRLKTALDEDNPRIAPFDESAWGNMADNQLPVWPSLKILDGVTMRWIAVWRALEDGDFTRIYTHAAIGPVTLEQHLHFYAWHARHHIAQIASARNGGRPLVSSS
jgi:uncharacterized damage-inducible protein DinB